MNFNETISPLSQFLMSNYFSIAGNSQHFIEYSSGSVIISLAYDNIDHLFYVHIGQDQDLLTELTPSAIKTVFDEESFQFQSTLTIENLISFLKGKGKPIILGDTTKLQELKEFADTRAKEFTENIMHLQHLKGADFAWERKDYHRFIECIQKTNQNILPQSYLKKYKIALARIGKQK